ncbi:hypothetical protein NUU61_003692 [Penicillium alfredii]|uniref:rRNA methyltransferase 2, mitochondrial n=1 Tax=Penicillium alfredii TaxID=1506179 RepID=A0A9W9FJU2_9EURO|nr:uncharacterized protein NUU61_003692 [Penicillium alfredii]KAJ5101470.1 hypothetical protein NUU61_003692 [Penicillium alfredii]
MAGAQEPSGLDYEMSIRTLHLEKEYEKTLADSARLLDAERDRVRRMEHLLLKFESQALRSQLEQANGQLFGLANAESEACLQLDEACREIDSLDLRAQASSSEIQKLKGQISTFNNSSTDYNTILSEKLHLSRDISNLRSENERLKTQNSSHQNLITKSREMERQLNSLEIALENERHAHERTQAKESQQAAEITKLSAQSEELRNELMEEARGRQQLEQDSRQRNLEWDNQRTKLEGRIEYLTKQLRSTRDKLQESHNDSQQRRANVRFNEDGASDSRPSTIPPRRSGPDHGAGMTIATPGAVRVQDKIKRQSALPGDKSAFSITPFLNRTGARTDSPISSEGEEEPPTTNGKFHGSSTKDSPSNKLHDHGSVLQNPPAPRQAAVKSSKLKPKPRQGKSAIEDSAAGPKKPASRLDSNVHSRESDEPRESVGQTKPKKRKLGAQRERILFDEEEEEHGENRKTGRKLPLGMGRSSVLGTLPPATLSGERTGGFGAPMGFSPLKRDRKRLGGQTVVDLGYAPGSWSQVAVSRTQPQGRVLGVDIIPAQPPKGVSTIQGNFLSPEIQTYIQEFLCNPNRGRPRHPAAPADSGASVLELDTTMFQPTDPGSSNTGTSADKRDGFVGRTVDVVLSDMSAPWFQTSGFWKRSLSDPYHRMMNTSGINFRDHAGSMDLCHAALRFSSLVLKTGGHFVCKFYQGAEDKELERQLRDLFQKVYRLKPESSRSVSPPPPLAGWYDC